MKVWRLAGIRPAIGLVTDFDSGHIAQIMRYSSKTELESSIVRNGGILFTKYR